MFALVEPILLSEVADRPDLGCASLMGALKARGVPARFIPGQTRFIADFLTDWEEITAYALDFKVSDPESPPALLQKNFREKGAGELRREFSGLYNDLAVAKNLKSFLRGELVDRFIFFYKAIMGLYIDQIAGRGNVHNNLIGRYLKKIFAANPDRIGFSLLYSRDVITRTLIRRLKEETSLPIILGGSLITKLAGQGAQTILKENRVDYLITHEGEEALPLLLEALRQGKPPRGPNVIYSNNGVVRETSLRPVENLDSLAEPDYSQFLLEKYIIPQTVLPLQTSRGCSWRKCTFCTHSCGYIGYRTYSPQRVAQTVKNLHHLHRCRHFVFHDEELPPERASIISESLGAQAGIYFADYARPTGGFTAEVFRKMYRSGFRMMQWGVESGSQDIINSMQKGTRIQTVQKVLQESHCAGITNICWLLFGFPGENEQTQNETYGFLERNKNLIDDILPSIFQLERGSLMYRNPSRWKLEIENTALGPLRFDVPFKSKNILAKDASAAASKVCFQAHRYSSSTIRCLSRSNLLRMLHFLVAAHESIYDLSPPIDRKWIPVAFPTIVKNEESSFFTPYCYTDTKLNNFFRSKKKKPLNNLEYKVLELCDGRHSIDNIDEIMMNEFGLHYEKEKKFNLVHWIEKLAKEKMILFFKIPFNPNNSGIYTRSRWSLTGGES